MLSLKAVLAKILQCCYTETTDSNDWVIRQYANGRKMCWRSFGYNGTDVTTSSNGGYVSGKKTISFPKNLFSTTPKMFTTIYQSDGIPCGFVLTTRSSSGAAGRIWALQSTANTDFVVYLLAIGT